MEKNQLYLFKYHLLILLFLALNMDSSFAQSITVEQKEVFKQRTEERLKDLELSIISISNKDGDRAQRRATVLATCDLFNSPKNIFQVSSKTSGTTISLKIKDYFTRLMILDYAIVEIKWYQSHWLSNWRKKDDNKYYANMRVYQIFKGMNSERDVMYQDTTVKDIEVIIDVVDIESIDGSMEYLIVKFGDVSVVETR